MKLLDRSILGTGWAFPPTFSRPAASVEMASDDVDVRQSLWILLSTALGERIMLPQYGCAIWQLVFRNVTTGFKTQVAEAVRQAIVDWEPRVDLGEVDVTSTPPPPGLSSSPSRTPSAGLMRGATSCIPFISRKEPWSRRKADAHGPARRQDRPQQRPEPA